MNSATIVQKLWNYCNVLRDDGMSYGDYVEQLTYLPFLKMADERSRPPYKQASLIPEPYAWPALLKRDGDDLFDHYRHTLEKLGAGKGTPRRALRGGARQFALRQEVEHHDHRRRGQGVDRERHHRA